MSNSLGLSKEELELFLEETEEQLEVLETDLMQLETNGYSEEVVARTFRAAHTIKGSSATLGHQQMTAMTHALENLLDQIRKRILEPEPQLMDTLLAAVDSLRNMERNLQLSLEDPDMDPFKIDSDTAEILKQLRLLTEDSQSQMDMANEHSELDLERARDAESIWQRVEEGKKEGLQSLNIKVQLAPDSIMPSVRAYQIILTLEELGEVLWSEPDMAEIEAEKIEGQLNLLLLTKQPREVIRSKITEVTDVTSVEIKVYNRVKRKDSAKAPGRKAGVQTEDIRSELGRTVRIDVSILDSLLNMVGELVIDRNRLAELIGRIEQNDMEEISDELNQISNHIGLITGMLQEEILRARLLPVDRLFKKFPRMVRDLAKQSGKEIDFRIIGEDTELDRSIIEYIGDPLIHLLRNAVDHGIEPPAERLAGNKPATATVELRAERQENQIIISVSDDGRGMDPQELKEKAIAKGIISKTEADSLDDEMALGLIFTPGFSTAEAVSEISGRGVGMDVVQKNIEAVGGRIDIISEPRQGTTMRIMLPLTMATIRALMVRIGGSIFAIPLSSVLETLKVEKSSIQKARTKETLIVRDQVIPLVRLRNLFEMQENEAEDEEYFYAVLVYVNGKQVGLVVDSLVGEQEVVIKSLGSFLGDIPGMAGATVLGDGTLALILDVPSLFKPAYKTQRLDIERRDPIEGVFKN